MSKLPKINKRIKVCIICEGFEDHAYINKLIDMRVWNDQFEFIPINVKSASKIFPRYHYEYNNNRYAVILIFCDTDRKPYSVYTKIKKDINDYYSKNTIADKLIIFANPCTMQIILSHFGQVSLTTQSKTRNAQIIFQLTGIKNYDAHEDQIKQLCSKINRNNYNDMKERIFLINNGDTKSGSTNFIDFINKFESSNSEWVNEINDSLK